MRMGNDDVLRNVAANVRRARVNAGISQAALAERAGLSRRTIVNLEAGEANVSLSGLDRIAAALSTTFVTLVVPSDASSRALHEVAWRGERGGVATLLASIHTRAETQVWSWSLGPGERYEGEPDPSGWSEVVIVTSGRLRVELEDETLDVPAGEQVNYSSAQRYAYVASGDHPAQFFRFVLS